MTQNKVLVIIPARGGSKGLPKKNILPLNGKPLIHYTIEAALECFDKNDICISTDDQEIIEVVEQTGINVPFVRPDALAADTSGTYEVLIHAIDYYESIGRNYKIVLLLQPTSPLRNGTHIQEALELYKTSLDMVVSVNLSKANPYYNLFEEGENGYLTKSKKSDFIRRQDCPDVWEYNGAIYAINIESLRQKAVHKFEKVVKYEMDERSSVDIDNKFDFELVQYLLSK